MLLRASQNRLQPFHVRIIEILAILKRHKRLHGHFRKEMFSARFFDINIVQTEYHTS